MHPVSTNNTVSLNLPWLQIKLNYLTTISMTCIIPLRDKEWTEGGGVLIERAF